MVDRYSDHLTNQKRLWFERDTKTGEGLLSSKHLTNQFKSSAHVNNEMIEWLY